MKKITLLFALLLVCGLTVKVNTADAKDIRLTEEQVQRFDEFRAERLAEIQKIEDEITAKQAEIVVVKNTKIAERFQQEKIKVLNKDIKKLEKQLKKAEDKFQKDFITTYNSMLTKEQAKTMKLKKRFFIFDKPCTLPSYPDDIKKERNW